MQSNVVSTVVQFPFKNVRSTIDPEEIAFRLEEMKLSSVEDAMSFLIPPLFESFTSIGFDIVDDDKGQLVIELIRSMMYDHFGLIHRFDEYFETNREQIKTILGDEYVLEEG